jgi:hypothetical protein
MSSSKIAAVNAMSAEHPAETKVELKDMVPISTPTPVRNVLWRVVFQTLGGKLYLHQVPLLDTSTSEDALTKLKSEYQRILSLHPFRVWDKMPIIFSPVIETAMLSLVSLIYDHLPFDGSLTKSSRIVLQISKVSTNFDKFLLHSVNENLNSPQRSVPQSCCPAPRTW